MKTKIERYIEKFINSNFDKKDREKDISLHFEWFVNSLHCWEYSSQAYNCKPLIGKDISLGKAQGGDAFFILVGNKIFSLNDNLELIKETISSNNNKIEFHLIQVKFSNSVKLGDFKNFVEVPIKVISDAGIDESQIELKKLVEFIKKIKSNPELEASFILTFYTAKNQNDLNKLRESWKADIDFIKNQYESYGDVEIHLEGSQKLNGLFEKFNSNEYKLIFPKDSCKHEGNYLIGFLTAKNLLDSIAPISNGKRVLYPDVFKNNIRLYLGSTEVNQKIEETLIAEPEKFHLYNNGLTITTKSIKHVLDNYVISPVNIVNGCQTANSLYNVFKVDTCNNIENVKIPVKIIVADDEEYEKITIRTNTQNGISEKDLLSIDNLQEDLEELLKTNTFQGKSFVYKRQKTVSNDFADVDYIVTIDDVLRAFYSTVLFIPHKVAGYFDKTTAKLLDIVFEDRFLKLYQIVVSLYKIMNTFLSENYPSLNRQRYHILYLLYKFANKNVDIEVLENYFIKDKNKKDFETLEACDIKLQSRIIEQVYSNLALFSKDEECFKKVVDYIIDVLRDKYKKIIELETKEDERILYLTVDCVQKGKTIFKNFSEDFEGSLKDFIKVNNEQ